MASSGGDGRWERRSRSPPRKRNHRPAGPSGCTWGTDDRVQPTRWRHARQGRISMRVIVADDSVLFREGLVRLLEASGMQVVGRAADGAELEELVRDESPDI